MRQSDFLTAMLPEVGTDLPGLRNRGMFASHELRDRVPERDDWNQLCEQARPLLSHRGRDLVERLGFRVEDHGAITSVRRSRWYDTQARRVHFIERSVRGVTNSTLREDRGRCAAAAARSARSTTPSFGRATCRRRISSSCRKTSSSMSFTSKPRRLRTSAPSRARTAR